jgi:hypothetical protein
MNKAQKWKQGNYGEKLSGKEYINIEPGDAKFIVKELQKKGFKGKLTGIADESGDVLKQAEKADHKSFIKTYKKQPMKKNVKDHQQFNDYVVYENDPGFMNWKPKAPDWKPFKSTIDEVAEMLEPIVKKGEGGAVGLPPIILNEQPKEIPDMVGPPYETNNPNEAIKEILRRTAGSGVTGIPIGGDVSLNFPYGTNREYDFGIGYNTSSGDGISGGYAVNVGGDDIMGAAYNSPGGTFSAGVNKKEGSKPEFRLGFKKKFAKGGKAWQPKSAPKLTTTIPPERGPTPHGLTYLTGDDIVKHRIG